MALAIIKNTHITGIVSVVPTTTEDNLLLEIVPETERQSLVEITGIRFRKVAAPGVTVATLCKDAVSRLLEKMAWDANTIDVLVCVTQSPDIPLPSISCRLHGEFNMPIRTLCFDINSGCSGFVYGLYTVGSLLAGMGKKKRAILCCGDISTSFAAADDRAVSPVFSDGVSAIAIETGNTPEEITGYFNLETDGTGRNAIKAGAATSNDPYMRMEGIDIFNYSMKHVPRNVTEVLSYAQKDISFPDMFVFHQANKLINESIRKRIGIPPEKVPYSLYEYGNTSSATIPITLGTAWGKMVRESGWILVSGFGVGFSMASGLVKFSPQVCESPVQVS